ncbi:MAG: sulfite exporter TauE/SafE family protein [Chthoniobacter sp.]|nr:sulfite exporter TauE/SafE family protein [Chthoniobacter sp.]
MNAADFATPFAAFLAGMVTSVHCAAMCGPLGCALLGTKTASPAEWRHAVFCYHAARAVSYASVGALLGGIGMSAGGLFHAPVSRALPWAMASFFVIIALGWERKIPRLAIVNRWLFRLNLRTTSLSRHQAAALLGAATPFLPCGPLYLAFGVSLVSGSWFGGAAIMISFALGTIPLFAFAQIGALRWQRQFSPQTQLWTRRVLALGSAALISGRAVFHDGSLLTPIKCLLCHY